jgi:hypothetical protein
MTAYALMTASAAQWRPVDSPAAIEEHVHPIADRQYYRTREQHAALMRARSKTLRRRATYLANTTPERRREIARNAWEHRAAVQRGAVLV